jgi:c-di-GMP-binding flagellar brake protein YcgR
MAGNDTQTEAASFIITRRMNIIEKLLRMERLSILISVTPATEPESGFVTTIVTVLPGKNIFAMDVSEDAGLNRALQNSGKLIFTATVDGVGMRFEARALITATLRGSPVFAVPIPTSMYWPQQRRSY